MTIYKACDIRGKYPDEIDAPIMRQIGRALATEGEGNTFVVGGDVRQSTPELKDALCEGLTSAGSDVVDLGTVPTPAVYRGKDEMEIWGAAIGTASHNPAEVSGLKFMLGWLPPTPDAVQRLKKLIETDRLAEGDGTLTARSVKEDYLAWLKERYEGSGSRLRVLVDAGNGCASEWAPQAFRDAGYEVQELNCEPDGTFPSRSPNPSNPENLKETARAVAAANVDFGAAFDGDGDRVVFLDSHGHVVNTERAIIILARAALGDHAGGSVIYDLKCTEKVADEVERMGGRALRERSGHSFIKTRLITDKAAFAGEASGHFFFGELGRDDGIYAALRMGQVIAGSGSSLADLADSVPDFYISPDIRVSLSYEEGAAVVERLKKDFSGYPQEYKDGVRIEFDGGWALCRQSVTEPAITLRFEADTPERLEEIKKQVMEKVPTEDA